MYATFTFPLRTYSCMNSLYDSSCHCLQNGHWKSLAMMTQVFAALSPAMRPLSAAMTSASVAADFEAAGAPVPSARGVVLVELHAAAVSAPRSAAPKLTAAFSIR